MLIEKKKKKEVQIKDESFCRKDFLMGKELVLQES